MFLIKKSRTFSLYYRYARRINKGRFGVVLNDINIPEYGVSISALCLRFYVHFYVHYYESLSIQFYLYNKLYQFIKHFFGNKTNILFIIVNMVMTPWEGANAGLLLIYDRQRKLNGGPGDFAQVPHMGHTGPLCYFHSGIGSFFGLSQSFIFFIHGARSTNSSCARGTGG